MSDMKPRLYITVTEDSGINIRLAFGENSYYGDEKKAASTVLTSFVAKCFQIANRFTSRFCQFCQLKDKLL